MLRSNASSKSYLLCILVSLVVPNLVSAFSKSGELCFIGENDRGVCVQNGQCKTRRILEHQNYLCSTPYEEGVCCSEYEHDLKKRVLQNAYEFRESQRKGEQLVDPETIYDAQEAQEDSQISDRKKHSISIATFNRKQTSSDDYTRSPILEPNQLRPTYVEENSYEPLGKADSSNLQPFGYFYQTRPEMDNNRESNKYNQMVHEQYSTVMMSSIPNSAAMPYGEVMQTNPNVGRPQRKPQQGPHKQHKRPATQIIQKTTEKYHNYEKTTVRPSTTRSPWQEAPRPLIEDENGYPVPPPPKRPQTNKPSNRPKPIVKRISDIKCKQYSELVTETIAGLPLTTDPKPVEKVIQKCSYNANRLIVGGQNTSIGEFPHMAAVGFLDRKKRSINWNCGGSLISEHFVLTAAHCTTSSLGLPTVVRLGEHNLVRSDDGAHPVDYLVKQVIKHEGYQPPVRYHDIALLRLSRTVVFTPQIRPACLYSKSAISNHKTIATGWGRIDYAEEQSDVLLKVVLSIISNEKCNELYEGESKTEILSKGIVAQQICAGELTGGKDTCQGDSGGPIEITTQGNKCIHHVIGVTSFGKRCAKANAPGVYTRVSSYLTWIEGVVWPELVQAIQSNHSYSQS